MPPRQADSAGLMSTFPLGPMQVRRSGYGVLRAAVAAGVDHIDTAQYYGPGAVNDLIREALYPYPDGLAIVSKVAVRRDDDGAALDEPDQLRHAVAGTAIAFVPFGPLGWPRGRDNPVLTSPVVTQTAARLGITPAQVALEWLLQLAPT